MANERWTLDARTLQENLAQQHLSKQGNGLQWCMAVAADWKYKLRWISSGVPNCLPGVISMHVQGPWSAVPILFDAPSDLIGPCSGVIGPGQR